MYSKKGIASALLACRASAQFTLDVAKKTAANTNNPVKTNSNVVVPETDDQVRLRFLLSFHYSSKRWKFPSLREMHEKRIHANLALRDLYRISKVVFLRIVLKAS